MAKPSADLEPQLVSVRETRRLLGIGNTKAYELIGSGELRSIRVGRARRVTLASIKDFVERRLAEAQPRLRRRGRPRKAAAQSQPQAEATG
jgi:excisionase family DNA binding protein